MQHRKHLYLVRIHSTINENVTYSPLAHRQHYDNFAHMNLQESFGKRILELRKDKKWTQEALAFKAGINRTYMRDVENGKRNVSIQNIEKIIKALGVTYVEFLSQRLSKRNS